MRRVVLEYFSRAGIDLKPEHEVHNVVHAISMITSTRAVMLLPAYTKRYLPEINNYSSGAGRSAHARPGPRLPQGEQVADPEAAALQGRQACRGFLSASDLLDQPVPESQQRRVGLRGDRVNRIVAVGKTQAVFGQANQLSRQNIRSREREAPERNPLSCHGGFHQRVRIGEGGSDDIAIKRHTGRPEPGAPRHVTVDQQRLRNIDAGSFGNRPSLRLGLHTGKSSSSRSLIARRPFQSPVPNRIAMSTPSDLKLASD